MPRGGGGKSSLSPPHRPAALRRLLKGKKKTGTEDSKGALELKETDGRGSTPSFVEAPTTNKGTRRKLILPAAAAVRTNSKDSGGGWEPNKGQRQKKLHGGDPDCQYGTRKSEAGSQTEVRFLWEYKRLFPTAPKTPERSSCPSNARGGKIFLHVFFGESWESKDPAPAGFQVTRSGGKSTSVRRSSTRGGGARNHALA